MKPLRIYRFLFSSQGRRIKEEAPFEIAARKLSNRLQNSQKISRTSSLSARSPPLCFRSGRLIFIRRRIVPMTSIGLIWWGARSDKSGRGTGWVVLKWKFCQLQSGLQEGAAAPSDDLRPRPLQWWRVRQSGTAGVSLSNCRAAVILRSEPCDRLD